VELVQEIRKKRVKRNKGKKTVVGELSPLGEMIHPE
jgi:hypothetical protein